MATIYLRDLRLQDQEPSRVAKSDINRLIAGRGAFQAALLEWYRARARRLPWRQAPSLYKTAVSEFMLQQTQVKTVLPYFARWMAELPDWAALASSSEARVLKLWEGLGYYSRARRLRRLAQVLAALPEIPRAPAAWRELPGIGPYTAAAITSIAFGEPAACVDGNVVRILARLTADGTRFLNGSAAAKAFTPLAEQLVCAAAPGDHNQAMMELGATVCLRSNPVCPKCPVRSFCAAARLGRPSRYPRLAPKTVERRSVLRVWCECGGALLLHRSAEGPVRLAGLYELPTAEQAGVGPEQAESGPLLARKQRSITRYRITESIHAAPVARGRGRAGLAWVRLDRLDSIVLSGPHRRWVTEILSRDRSIQSGLPSAFSNRALPPRSPAG
jgi:A/G-specific adenine glycosylase